MDILKRPKAEAIDVSTVKPPPPRKVKTVHALITDDDSHPRRISLLKKLQDHQGPWQEYWEFYQKNLSGDVETMRKEDRAYVEKMRKDLIEYQTKEMR